MSLARGQFEGTWAPIPYGCQHFYNPEDKDTDPGRILFNNANSGVVFENNADEPNIRCLDASDGWCLKSQSDLIEQSIPCSFDECENHRHSLSEADCYAQTHNRYKVSNPKRNGIALLGDFAVSDGMLPYGCQYWADSGGSSVLVQYRRILFNRANEGTAAKNKPSVGNSLCPSAACGYFTTGSDPICKGRSLPIPPTYYMIDTDTEFNPN